MTKRQRIIELRNQGLTRREIAQALGCTQNALNQQMKSLLADGRLEPLPQEEIKRRHYEAVGGLDAVQIAEARQLRDEGLSFVEIGSKFGVCDDTVAKKIGRGKRITPLQQQLIALRLEGLTVDEIASKLGKARGTVGVLLARLVQRGLIKTKKWDDKWQHKRATASPGPTK